MTLNVLLYHVYGLPGLPSLVNVAFQRVKSSRAMCLVGDSAGGKDLHPRRPVDCEGDRCVGHEHEKAYIVADLRSVSVYGLGRGVKIQVHINLGRRAILSGLHTVTDWENSHKG